MELGGLREADVVINGRRLTFGQSMALRVAVGSFLMSVTDPEHAAELGPIAGGYAERLKEVSEHIHKTWEKTR